MVKSIKCSSLTPILHDHLIVWLKIKYLKVIWYEMIWRMKDEGFWRLSAVLPSSTALPTVAFSHNMQSITVSVWSAIYFNPHHTANLRAHRYPHMRAPVYTLPYGLRCSRSTSEASVSMDIEAHYTPWHNFPVSSSWWGNVLATANTRSYHNLLSPLEGAWLLCALFVASLYLY